jgi:lipopolysaccharide/colanic/teichoic acid biosynthesis glycosyltransferase
MLRYTEVALDVSGASAGSARSGEFAPRDGVAGRVCDAVLATLILVLAAPVLAVAALAVRLTSRGPAIYRQVRVGRHGRPFTLYKLRSMVHDCEAQSGPCWSTGRRDQRVTRVGRILRRSHVDELPQLWNVIRGDMSLVGPRPEQPAYVAELERVLPFYDRRHLMRPGLTGWAQLRCGYAGTPEGAARKLCHDLYYARHRSVGFDLLILAETAAELLAPRSRRGT